MSILTITDGRLRPYILFSDNIPRFVPSSGSIGDNGALTLTTALDLNAYANAYMYFPANAIAAGVAAGLYYTVMSSATAGTIYNNTYASGRAEIPSSPTAFATIGPGAYIQTTASDITLLSFTLPANTLGANGSLFSYPHLVLNSSGNNKIYKMIWGGTVTNTLTYGTTGQSPVVMTVRNKGVTNRQISNNATGFVASSASPGHIAIDTTADKTVLITAQLANASDYAGIAGFMVQINPSA